MSLPDPMALQNVPPGAPDREEAIVSLVVGRWAEVADAIGGAAGLRGLAEDFKGVALAEVLRAAAAVLDAGGEPDAVTVGARVPDGPMKAKVGELVAKALDFSAANLEEHTAAVRDTARTRRLIEAAERLRVGARRLEAGDRTLFTEALAEVHAITAPRLEVVPQGRVWPTLEEDAIHGPMGDFVREVAPHTEAAPVAILAQGLVAWGNALGRGPHALVGAARHHANEYLAVVGRTALARKGTGWAWVDEVMAAADEGWLRDRVRNGGLASGEGLVHMVRDRREAEEIGADGQVQRRVVDQGVADKRLLVVEEEFAGVLRVAKRDGSILSEVARKAWDKGTLANHSKRDPATATGAHVSLIGHITVEDLRQFLGATDMFNGFGNRFVWLLTERVRVLPEGPDPALVRRLVESHGHALRLALTQARQVGVVGRDEQARDLWGHLYRGELAVQYSGVLDGLLARGAPHVLRLSVIYALLDGARTVGEVHLRAAAALWRYSVASAKYLFGGRQSSGLAGEVLRLVREAGPSGLTRTQVRDAVGRGRAEDLGAAIEDLAERGAVALVRETTGGRPRERVVLGPRAGAA